MSEPETLDVITAREPKSKKLSKWPVRVLAVLAVVLTAFISFDAGRTVGKSHAYEVAAATQAADLKAQKQNIDHVRWFAAIQEKASAIPPDNVLNAAYRGDKDAIQKLSESDVASQQVNDAHLYCLDLTVAYEASAKALAKQPGGPVALRRNRLPVTLPGDYCSTGTSAPYVPAAED